MIKKFSYICFGIIFFLDKIFKFLTKRSILIWFKDFIEDKSYKTVKVLNKDIKFFTPNYILNYLVETYFTKEPETIEWIDSFEKKKFIFWDIGANIGLYSIYNAVKNPRSTTIAFEPSSSNLRILTRNISINNLQTNIKIVPIPLTNKENVFQEMRESNFIEGSALHSFGEKFNFEGKNFSPNMRYDLLGTTMNYFIEKSILDIPDYIKIDVDGIEHLILEGGSKFLSNKKVKSMSIEINENFKEQYEKVLSLMNKFKFKILHKKHNKNQFEKNKKLSKIYNYVFIRQK